MEDRLKCPKCHCWRDSSQYMCDSVGRRNLTCEACCERDKRNKAGRSSKCPHGLQKHYCSRCPGGGTSLCDHKVIRSRCVACGGASVCQHKRQRYRCRLCKELAAKGVVEVKNSKRENRIRECVLSEIDDIIRRTAEMNADIKVGAQTTPITTKGPTLTDDELAEILGFAL